MLVYEFQVLCPNIIKPKQNLEIIWPLYVAAGVYALRYSFR